MAHHDKGATKRKGSSCPLCKPHKNGWTNPRSLDVKRQDEKDHVDGMMQMSQVRVCPYCHGTAKMDGCGDTDCILCNPVDADGLASCEVCHGDGVI